MMSMLTSKFSVLPTYLGSSVEVVLEGGKQFTNIGGQLQEVVYATTSELAKLPYDNLAEGFYLVGSGNTGVASALACTVDRLLPLGNGEKRGTTLHFSRWARSCY